jgi:hypothetical protein
MEKNVKRSSCGLFQRYFQLQIYKDQGKPQKIPTKKVNLYVRNSISFIKHCTSLMSKIQTLENTGHKLMSIKNMYLVETKQKE